MFGVEKLVYGLHQSAFVSSIDLWSNDEQREYWNNYMYEYDIIIYQKYYLIFRIH